MDQDNRTFSFYWIVILSVYLFYIFGHEPISQVCYYLSDTYTKEVYSYYVKLIGKIIGALFSIFIIWGITKTNYKKIKILLWSVFGVFMFTTYNIIVLISIEYVHFIQYCILTWLLFYACKEKYAIAFIVSVFAGIADEVYQAVGVGPLNFRDTLLNVVGSLLGLLLVSTIHDSLIIPLNSRRGLS